MKRVLVLIIFAFFSIDTAFPKPHYEKRKTALITGSISGIGLSIAIEMAKAGYNVVLNGFGDVDAAVAQVSAFGTKVIYHGADLRNPAEIKDMFRGIERTFDGLDVLVNNAGIQRVHPIEEFPVDEWNDIIAVNLTASFLTTRLALPYFRKKGWGRIINIASTHGLVASVNKAAYVAAKHGIIGLTKVTALETADSDITCNAVCPGWVLTPLVQKQIEDRARQKGASIEKERRALVAEKHPSGKFVTPKEIAQVVIFLCTPAANQMRGSQLVIDGGWTAQ
ncbi:MAG: 3-hydroxybutyrate dehydrogenase [Holosporales bacterium]|nr:3-hydroxybutyrate dehydrogenase [Holosporales bacterium]